MFYRPLNVVLDAKYYDNLKLKYIQMEEALEIEKINNKKLQKDYDDMRIIWMISLFVISILYVIALFLQL